MPDNFQDLPESKYPRSYTPSMRKRLMIQGGFNANEGSVMPRSYERPVSTDIEDSERDAAMSSGEKSVAKKKMKPGTLATLGNQRK